MSNEVYDRLKTVALVLLPALAVLVLVVNPLWNIPDQDAIAGAIIAIDLLLGLALRVSSRKYGSALAHFDGYLGITGEDPDTGIASLGLTITRPVEDFFDRGYARFKIGSPPVEMSRPSR